METPRPGSTPKTFYKTLETTVKVGGTVQPVVRLAPEAPGPLDEPESLTKNLSVIVCTFVFIVISAVALLFLAGFHVGGFELHPSVLAALVGGISIQFVAAMVSPLVRGISSIHIEQIRNRRSRS